MSILLKAKQIWILGWRIAKKIRSFPGNIPPFQIYQLSMRTLPGEIPTASTKLTKVGNKNIDMDTEASKDIALGPVFF